MLLAQGGLTGVSHITTTLGVTTQIMTMMLGG